MDEMDEYINREAARPDAFCIGVSCLECPFLKSPLYGGCRIDDFIASLPAAEVRPVVRAHWIDHRTIEHDGEWYCSNCGNEVTICMCGKDKTPSYPFCPNCGADMRGENDVDTD